GIYSLREGRLTLCLPDRKDLGKRPVEFKTRDGDGLIMMVLERSGRSKSSTDAHPGKTAAPETITELEGEWRTIEFERDGKRSPSYEVRSNRDIWTFKGNEVSEKSDGSYMSLGARFKLDPTQSPKTIDLTWVGSRLKGQTQVGIYAIQN